MLSLYCKHGQVWAAEIRSTVMNMCFLKENCKMSVRAPELQYMTETVSMHERHSEKHRDALN